MLTANRTRDCCRYGQWRQVEGCPPPGRGASHDPRVWRGSNFSRSAPAPPPTPVKKTANRRRAACRGGGDWGIAVGRQHADVQCDPTLFDELEPRVAEVGAQTDLRLVANIEILWVKSGEDACSQVTDADLVSFEEEAWPVCRALVATTLEAAAVQVLYQDDATALRHRQAEWEQACYGRMADVGRLEIAEAERRELAVRALDKARRSRPERAVFGRALAVHYMAGLRDDALAQLTSARYLHAAENTFADWLSNRLRGHCRRHADDDDLMRALIRDVIADRSSPNTSVFAH